MYGMHKQSVDYRTPNQQSSEICFLSTVPLVQWFQPKIQVLLNKEMVNPEPDSKRVEGHHDETT
jgi:hypothetical protein